MILPTKDTTDSKSTSFSSASVTLTDKRAKKNIQRRKITKELPAIKKEIPDNIKPNENSNGVLICALLLIAIIVAIASSSSKLNKADSESFTSTEPEDAVSDYLERIILPRREYYRNVYLKSAAWKRKRYLVLKRDNWRCIYCGAAAAEVHHTRYAKNIGKEPIEWLVSTCKTCHRAKH